MKLKIFDSMEEELQLNDLVQMQNRQNGNLTFYTKIQVENGSIFPLSMFTYDRIIKVESIPHDCKHIKTENGFEYWMHPNVELIIIESKLDKWKWENIMFFNNPFFKVYPD